MVPYELGLHEVADGVFAYLQPDGSWGYSNAGLVVGDGESLLVDTLFDLQSHRGDAGGHGAAHAEAGPITTVVNTHANGDHCHGNQLVPGARVITSAATAREMADLPASSLHGLKQLDLGADGNALRVGGLRSVPLRRHRRRRSDRDVLRTARRGRRAAGALSSEEVGPAHTGGDVIVHVPDAGVVFAGDILFIGSTPIVWAGPFGELARGPGADPGIAAGRRRARARPGRVRPPVAAEVEAYFASCRRRRPSGRMPA